MMRVAADAYVLGIDRRDRKAPPRIPYDMAIPMRRRRREPGAEGTLSKMSVSARVVAYA